MAAQNNTILIEKELHEKSRVLLSGQEDHYRILQTQSSPYSHKVMTYMNYKGIPYKRIHANQMDISWGIKTVGQSIVPIVVTPDEQIMQDSTPILEHFEKQYPQPATIPDSPMLSFFMWLLEDFADEYLQRLQMHTRWGNDLNIETASHKIARNFAYGVPKLDIKSLAPVIQARQKKNDILLGLEGDAERQNLDQQILDLLCILDAHLEQSQFLLGNRPSMADFAFYGPLMIHLYSDPQSNHILETNAPRVCNWLLTIQDLGDTRGCAGQTEFGDWKDTETDLPATLIELLKFISQTYIPVGRATAKASVAREKRFETTVYGVKTTFGTIHYKAWAFEQTQLRYQALTSETKAKIDGVLLETGILPGLLEDGVLHNGLYDGFTPPFIKDGIPDARIKYLKEKQKSTA